MEIAMSPSKKTTRPAKAHEKKAETVKTVGFPWGRFLLGYGLYVFFHEIDRLLPGTILATIFGEGIESIYAHMKMLFYAYLILSLIDYFRMRASGLPRSFFEARMLILAAVPWMMIIVYYTVEAVGVTLPRSVELPWALVVTAFGLFFSLQLEGPLGETDFRPGAKWALRIAFLAALITYIGFSFAVPDNFFIAIA
jgi:hypothetical protein